MSVRPMSKCQTVKYVAAAGFLFLLILFFNYNLLLSEQYNSKVEEKKSDSEERLRRLERLMEREHPEIGNGQLEKRVNEIEKQIQERLPSSTDLLISDGRMNNLLGRLQKIEVTLKLLDNQRKSYVGIDSRVDLIEYRLDKMEKSSRIASSKNAKNNSCEVVHDWQYPFCDEKVQWMKSRWQDQYLCIVEEHKVDPFDMCSIIIYLSEVRDVLTALKRWGTGYIQFVNHPYVRGSGLRTNQVKRANSQKVRIVSYWCFAEQGQVIIEHS